MRLRHVIFTLVVLSTLSMWTASRADDDRFPQITSSLAIHLPADEGAHPDFRTEWWYVTGWLEDDDHHPIGFQVTFFRSRLRIDPANPSRFAPRQILMAHAAISDPRNPHVLFAERAAREGFGLASAAIGHTDVRLIDWVLQEATAGGVLSTHIEDKNLALDLHFSQTQPALLEGEQGYSRKGPGADAASAYYSEPQLKVEGTIREGTMQHPVHGVAWLDHEWSSDYLARDAVGWDWLGINFDDGGALMVFRMRDRAGRAIFSAATQRLANGAATSLPGNEITFSPQRWWHSKASGIDYPTGMQVRVGALDLSLEPLMEDQEIDARASTGTRYWEGAVRVLSGPTRAPSGHGYLELTGYGAPLHLE